MAQHCYKTMTRLAPRRCGTNFHRDGDDCLEDGEIRVDSTPGIGQECHRLPGLRVLVVEDNEINRLVLEEMLSREGAQVRLAEDGRNALDLLLQDGANEFDIVLMDIQMPGMDGHETTRRILKLFPDLPIIGQTAHAMAADREKCLAAGMVDHLPKPIKEDALLATLLKHLPKRANPGVTGFSPTRSAGPASLLV